MRDQACARCACWAKVGLQVPRQTPGGDTAHNVAFLREQGAIVVKPVDGEQGKASASISARRKRWM